ncbi:replication-relaxation family protein [Streptomyces sp. NBC_01176]|uniref:replication-relaxation family protein n=1 Tax=Streptomyces sp. NBC_01176 TaxID=2903760 RepID=UPI00386A5152|nr:replication-relaxation family protein [Streptomyces sp. NBC_01176]
MGGSLTYPYGSTSAVRGHVLAALGVLKVASADQMRRLTCPGHKDSKGVRNACLDLAKHGLTLSEGSARDGQKLWGLTLLGLTAAAEVLGRPAADMGGNARGAARSGAPHAMAVNETVIALTGTQPVPTRPVARSTPTTAPGTPIATAAPAVPAGFGSVGSWATEVVHNLPGTSRTRPSVRADAVLRAPAAGLPVLLVEVDRCTEADEVLAGKFARYHQYFRVKVKDPAIPVAHAVHASLSVPLWQSLYAPTGRDGYPPIAVVFEPGTRLGEQALKNRMNRVLDLTREHWSGKYQKLGGFGGEPDGFVDFTDAIPVLFTTLDRIQESGPLAPVWWRCGHRRWETLTDALDNPRDRRAWRRREDERNAARERKEGPAAAGDWHQRPIPAQPEPAFPPPPPCGTCGGPLKNLGGEDPSAPPPDGRTCEACRITEAAQPPTGLLKALFGRQDKQPRNEPPAWL